MEKVKIAVVGVGSMGRFHLEAHKINPNVELYALCDINEALLHERGKTYGVDRLYTNIDQMLEQLPEIEAVDVVTWNCAHAECSIKSLRAGKHVFCEKPMAMNAKEAQLMYEAAKASNKKLMVGFVRRFGDDCIVAKNLIEQDIIGVPNYAKVSYLRRNGCPGGWFSDKKRSGGGPLIDIGIHVIDMAWYLMGMPRPLSVMASAIYGTQKGESSIGSYTPSDVSNHEATDVEDMVAGMIRFENGAVMMADASYTLHIDHDINRIELYGNKGGLTIDPDVCLHTNLGGYMMNNTILAKSRYEDYALNNELAFFIEAIQMDKSLDILAQSGVTMMKILDAMYESAQRGCEVVIDN